MLEERGDDDEEVAEASGLPVASAFGHAAALDVEIVDSELAMVDDNVNDDDVLDDTDAVTEEAVVDEYVAGVEVTDEKVTLGEDRAIDGEGSTVREGADDKRLVVGSPTAASSAASPRFQDVADFTPATSPEAGPEAGAQGEASSAASFPVVPCRRSSRQQAKRVSHRMHRLFNTLGR